MSDTAAFDAFVQYEDQVQKAARELMGRVPKKPKVDKRSKAAAVGNLFELLAMEEQTRNQAFVNALQTQTLSAPLQGRALRCARKKENPWNLRFRCTAG